MRYFVGFAAYLVFAGFFLFFCIFVLRDIHRDGIEPVHLFPYRKMIFWGLVIYAILQLLISALVAFLLLYKAKMKVLMGYGLGCLVWIFYMIYFFWLWTVYWS